MFIICHKSWLRAQTSHSETIISYVNIHYTHIYIYIYIYKPSRTIDWASLNSLGKSGKTTAPVRGRNQSKFRWGICAHMVFKKQMFWYVFPRLLPKSYCVAVSDNHKALEVTPLNRNAYYMRIRGNVSAGIQPKQAGPGDSSDSHQSIIWQR